MDRQCSWKFNFTGDLMMGRGIDQVLPFSNDAVLYESWVRDAREYVTLAWDRLQKEHKADPHFLRGESILDPLLKIKGIDQDLDLWITNLETSLTTSSKPDPKGINYRSHPKNVTFLLRFQKMIRCPLVLSLANNHQKDWSEQGLLETLNTLERHKIGFTGAGRNWIEASKPYILNKGNKGKSRCVVFGVAHPSSGVPLDWGATKNKPGVFVIPKLSFFLPVLERLCQLYCQPNDVKILMIHWGGNWQTHIHKKWREACREWIEVLGFKVIVNSSPHHMMPIERYKGGIICYAPGDFVNDYFGIEDPLHENLKPDVGEVISIRLPCSGSPQVETHPFTRFGFQLHPFLKKRKQ